MSSSRSATPFEEHTSSRSPDPSLAVQAQLFGALSPLTEMSNEQARVQFEQGRSQSDRPATQEGFVEEGPLGDSPLPAEQQAEMEALRQDTMARQQRIEEERRRIRDNESRLEAFYKANSPTPSAPNPLRRRDTPPHLPSPRNPLPRPPLSAIRVTSNPHSRDQTVVPTPGATSQMTHLSPRIAVEPLRNLLVTADPRAIQSTLGGAPGRQFTPFNPPMLGTPANPPAVQPTTPAAPRSFGQTDPYNGVPPPLHTIFDAPVTNQPTASYEVHQNPRYFDWVDRDRQTIPPQNLGIPGQGFTTTNPSGFPGTVPQYTAQGLDQSTESDAAKPERFSGKEPDKLREFITACIVYFNNKPSKFIYDVQRVNFAVSYLTGPALKWWQPYLVAVPPPPICGDWTMFVAELNQWFGIPDLAQESQNKLKTLRMHDNQRITNYSVEFMEHAMHSGWNDTALMHSFYEGLANHVKEALTSRPRPQNLQDLRDLARDCDMRYWTRVGEKGRSPSSNNFSANQQRPPQTSTSRPNTVNNPRGGSSTSTSTSTSSRPQQANAGQQNQQRKDLANVLTQDGRLTEDEKERRKRLGLCTYCSEKPPKHLTTCKLQNNPPPQRGRATFVVSGEPEAEPSTSEYPGAHIEEVSSPEN